MRTKDIRDKILMKKAAYEQSLIASKNSVNRIQQLFGEIPEEVTLLLESQGYPISELKSIDFDKAIHDKEYLDEYRGKLNSVIEKLHKQLEAHLDV